MQGRSFDPRALHRVAEEATTDGVIVGCVVSVSVGGALQHLVVAGQADREEGRAMKGGAVFRLASLTKAVVCVTALALVEGGLLTLDDPVARWLPWFTPALQDGECPVIRIVDLMTHRSGLGYAFGGAAGQGYDAAGVSDGLDDSGITLEANMRRLAAMPLLGPPGEIWRYSLGIDVLGLLLEQAAGMPLAQIVEDRVLRPLGMIDTAFVAETGRQLVTPYADGAAAPVRMKAEHSVPMGNGLIRFAPARAWDAGAFSSGGTGLVGTATDFTRFLDAVRSGGGGVISREMAAAFVRNAVGDAVVGMAGSGLGWGLGVAIMRNPVATGSPLSAGSWMWGGVYGHSYWVDPARELSVTALTNTSLAGMAGPFPDAVKRAVYEGLAD